MDVARARDARAEIRHSIVRMRSCITPCVVLTVKCAFSLVSQVSGSSERPRISVYRSNQHVYVQVIDDENQKTLAALGTMSPKVKEVIGSEEWKSKTVDAAEQVGKMLGAMCVEQGITSAVFDRGGFLYHGRVKAVADGARAAGVAM